MFILHQYGTGQCHIMHIDGLVQDCSNSIASALELLQSCPKPSLSSVVIHIQISEVFVCLHVWVCCTVCEHFLFQQSHWCFLRYCVFAYPLCMVLTLLNAILPIPAMVTTRNTSTYQWKRRINLSYWKWNDFYAISHQPFWTLPIGDGKIISDVNIGSGTGISNDNTKRTCTNVDLSAKVFCDIQLRTTS